MLKRILYLSAILIFVGCSVTTTTTSNPDGPRHELTYEDLMSGKIKSSSPLDNGYFTPVGEFSQAHHNFQGTLTTPTRVLKVKSYIGDYYPIAFPEFSVNFITYEDYLVPAQRGIIGGKQGGWGVIIDPGKVWSESGDQGMSRASFPFTLLRSDPNNPRGHNGIATFLYDETRVSSLFVQIVQETNPDLKFDMWGQIPFSYAPGEVTDQETVEAQFALELAQQMEVHPWLELEEKYGHELLKPFNDDLAMEEISATGMVIDGILYLQPPMTRYGEYPYPRYMRYHVYSVSKSMGNGIAMLHLAQKYGDEVFELRISDYLDVTADHNGWDEVTFGDALNMAVGVGNGSHDRFPLDINADDTSGDKSFFLAQTAQEKLAVAFSYDNHPWGPGEIVRYINPHSTVLSAAMETFLKSQEGPDAHLWDMLNEEVFEPIGVFHLPMLHTLERDGSRGIPIMLLGLYPTVEDTAKIGMLLQNGGRYGSEQLLSPNKLEEALYQIGMVGLPTGKRFMEGDQAYHMSFWGHPYQSQENRYFVVPYMQGHGGNSVILAPNGIIGFRFSDAHNYDVEPLIQVAEAIHPFPGGWMDPVWLFPEDLISFSKFGFSLEHPALILPYENGLWWQGSASNSSGLVQFRYQPDSPETLGVLWDTPEALPDLEAFIDNFFTVLEDSGVTINEAEPFEIISKYDYEILVKRVKITEQGVQFLSTGVVWYCDISNRMYIFYYAITPEFASHQEAINLFQRYFDSFSCH